MPPELAAQLAKVLAEGPDPAKLDDLADGYLNAGFPDAAQQLRNRAMALRAAETARLTAQAVQQTMTGPPSAPTTQSPPTTAETSAVARQATESATRAAAADPALQQAAEQAATAAVTAARAAATANPATAVEAARQTAQAAATASASPSVQAAAQQVIQAANEAAQSNNPAAAQQVASAAADVARQTAIELDARSQNMPPPPAPTPAVLNKAAELAARMTENIRAKGCWKEDRSLVKAYQESEGGTATLAGRAGKADGLYGPKTALAAMAHVPKVPAPCYWPSQSTAKAAAVKQWADLVKSGKVVVGQVGAFL